VRSLIRPALVIADPAAMTSAPEPELRASSMNALAHGADSLYTPFANPVSRMTALHGAELIATSLDEDPAERNRAALAQGSILCAYAIDSAAFSLHHVVCQTLVRICGGPHAGVNAAILPRAMAFMAQYAPDGLEPLATAVGVAPANIESRLLELGGNPPGLGPQGADPAKLPEALDAMLLRPELAFTPDPPTRDELEQLIDAAW
jgi:maleylacetate reductase